MNQQHTCYICGQTISTRQVRCRQDTCRKEHQRRRAQNYRKARPDVIKAINARAWKKNGPKYKENKRLSLGRDLIKCGICGRLFEFLPKHLSDIHQMSSEGYRALYPNQPLATDKMTQTRSEGGQSHARRLIDVIDVQREPDRSLFEYLTGTLLGDASLELGKHALHARYYDGGANRLYALWKYEFIRQYFHARFSERVLEPDPRTGKRYTKYSVRTATYPLLTEWQKQWYRPRKIVPRDIIERYLTPFALTLWFCDDGHMGVHEAFLYPMAFSLDDVEWLQDLLRQRFGLLSTARLNKSGQPLIRIPAAARQGLIGLIAPYAIPGMEYKWQGRQDGKNTG